MPKKNAKSTQQAGNASLSTKPVALQINLTAPKGQTISLTSNQLDSWFAAIERKNPQTPADTNNIISNPYLANIFISRFGFKNSNEILQFLNSAAGAHLRDLIAEELRDIADMEDYEFAVAEENNWLTHLKHALFFLGLLYEEDAHAKGMQQLKQLILEQQKQAQTTHDKNIKQAEYNAAAQQQALLQEQLEIFSHTYGALDKKLQQKMQESEDLEKSLTQLEQEKIALNEEFMVYDKAVSDLDEMVADAHQSPDAVKQIETQLAELKNNLEHERVSIEELLAKDQETEAMKLLKTHQAHHLKIAGLNNELDVLKGHKYYVDIHGKPVNTIQQAHLLIDIQKKMVKDQDGKCYVISVTEDLESIKQSENGHEKLNLAHRLYQKNLAENNPIHTMVAQNKSKKQEHHANRYNAALNRSTQLQSEIVVLSTQMLRIQSTRQALITSIQQDMLPLNAPNCTPVTAPVIISSSTTNQTPTPTPRPGMTLFQSTEYTSSKPIQLAFKLMLHNRTPQAIEAFKARLVEQHNPDVALTNTINQDLDAMKRLAPTTPVPETTTRNLLQNLARFGTQGKSPTLTTPTPFGIIPNPFI